MVGEHALANMFQEIKVDISLSESERICLYHMTRNNETNTEAATTVLTGIPSQPDNVLSSMELLVTLLDKITQYVDEVVNGSRQADPAVGILLADVMGSLKVTETYMRHQI